MDLFNLEDELSDLKLQNPDLSADSDQITILDQEISISKKKYKTMLKIKLKEQNILDILETQQQLLDKKVICLAAFMTTDSNCHYLDEIVDDLEIKIEAYSLKKRVPVPEKRGLEHTSPKFDNLVKLFVFCYMERHRILHRRNKHENSVKYPQNVTDLTTSINKKFSAQEGSIIVSLKELETDYGIGMKLNESEKMIFSGVFLIDDEVQVGHWVCGQNSRLVIDKDFKTVNGIGNKLRRCFKNIRQFMFDN